MRLKQFLTIAAAFSVGVFLGVLLPSQYFDDQVSEVLSQPPEIQESMVRPNAQKLVQPSLLNQDNQSTFSLVKVAALDAETHTFEELKDKLLSEVIDDRNNYLFRIYVQRMVSLNPAETIEFLELEEPLSRFFREAYCDWVSNDLDGALQYFLENKQSRYLKSSWRCFVRFEETKNHPNYPALVDIVGEELVAHFESKKVAKLPPQEAFMAAQSLSNQHKFNAMLEAGRRWVKEDLVGFLQVLAEVTNSNDVQNLIRNTLLVPLKDDPLTTLQLIENYLNLDYRSLEYLLGSTVGSMSFEEGRNFVEAYVAEAENKMIFPGVPLKSATGYL